MPSIVIGKVKGDQGEKGFSPTVTLTKNENILSISVTDETGTKTESIDTGEAVQADWNTTDTALNSYIKNKPEIPSKVSQLANDSGYLTDYTETDPTVPAWAKKATKPEYTATEVGALPSDTTHISGDVPITRKVNGKTLNTDITLSATDVGALPDTTTIPTALTDFGVTATASELNYVDGVTSNIQNQLNAKAATESPTLTGTPKAPTASADTNNSQIATTAFVQSTVNNKISDLVGGAPETMDTLAEVSAAIQAHQDVTDALNASIGNKVDKVTGKGLSTNDLTDALKSNYDAAYTHSTSAHAPSGAQANVIETVKVNGTALTPSSKAVNITVPTKISQLTNDSGFKTTDNNTTYSLTKSGSTITLTGSDGSTTSVTDSDTKYTHPTYTAKDSGLYKVTVDGTGHVSAATAVTKSDITALGIPGSDTNTHYASKNVVGSSTATSNTTSALTNGNVYLNSVENGTVTSTHKISGSGATTVTSDSSGNIIISSSDTNTDTKNTAGSTNTSSKIFLVGATSQAANPQTYSHDTAYVGTDGCLYSNSKKVSVEGHTHEVMTEEFIRGLFA